VVLEKIQIAELAQLWLQLFGIDISKMFSGVQQVLFCHCLSSDLKFFVPPIAGSGAFYDRLKKFEWYYLKEKAEYEYAARFIKKDDVVLDIGCGIGLFALKIPDKQNYVGLEPNLDSANEHIDQEITIIDELLEHHAVRNQEKYDVVCAFQVLEHVPNVREFLLQALLCLKESGLLIISVPAANSFMSHVTNAPLNMPPHHLTWWSDQCLSNICRILPLDIVAEKHEVVADMHLTTFARTLSKRMMLGKRSGKTKLVDFSMFEIILSKFASLLAKVILRGIQDTDFRPNGHSVTFVYRKRTK